MRNNYLSMYPKKALEIDEGERSYGSTVGIYTSVEVMNEYQTTRNSKNIPLKKVKLT